MRRWLCCLCCVLGLSVHAAQPPTQDVAMEEWRQAERLLLRLRYDASPAVLEQAESLVARLQQQAPGSARAWELRAWIEMIRHRFQPALLALEEAARRAPLSAMGLGLQADALVELGRYAEAVRVVQAMLDRQPGLPAYSRAAHLRFLHGDLQGAIDLMQEAVRAGRAHTEESGWVLIELGALYRHSGQLILAEQAASRALSVSNTQFQALTELARIRVAQARWDEAWMHYQAVNQATFNPEVLVEQWMLARTLGKITETKRLARRIEALARLDKLHGHLNRRAFVEYYAEQPNRASMAVRLAREEMGARPDIYSTALLAWSLYRSGKLDEASVHAEHAMAMQTPDTKLQRQMVEIRQAHARQAMARR